MSQNRWMPPSNHRTPAFNVTIQRFVLLASASLFPWCLAVAQKLPDAPSAAKQQNKQPASASTAEQAWPRTFTRSTDTFSIYQPQVDKWDGDRLYLYSAVEVANPSKKSTNYGVIWFNARAEIDKLNRTVTLDQLQLTKANFPAEPSKNSELMQLLEAKLPKVTRTVSLDRLVAATEADGQPIKTVEVKNDPPAIIFSTNQSVLVLIDGPAQMREIEGTKLQRVINTRAILLFENDKKTYYLRVSDWWLQAATLEGPWTYAKKVPDDMKTAEEYVVSKTGGQTLQTASSHTSSAQSGKGSAPPPSLKKPATKRRFRPFMLPSVQPSWCCDDTARALECQFLLQAVLFCNRSGEGHVRVFDPLPDLLRPLVIRDIPARNGASRHPEKFAFQVHLIRGKPPASGLRWAAINPFAAQFQDRTIATLRLAMPDVP
jgi:hypothetical protein